MRAFAVFLHRWAGLAMATFLVVVGLTGSLLAFLPELDRFFAPELFPPARDAAPMDMAQLARRAETLVPDGRTEIVYLVHPGTAIIYMEPRPGAGPLAFDRIYIDPVTGDALGRRRYDALMGFDDVMPFVYRLHYALALGPVGGWILGIVALVWTIDCFVGFYLTLPPAAASARRSFLARWKPAWQVKIGGSAYRFNFDLHRAGGLWLWAALLVFAWSSVYMNLDDVYTNVTSLMFDYAQSTYKRTDFGPPAGREPLSWEDAQFIARRLMDEEARKRGFSVDRPLALAIARDQGLYRYRVRSSRDIGDKYGWTFLYFDAFSGELRAVDIPTGDRKGNTFTTWITELHRADVFGLPYRIFVCFLGLAITMLSITGVYIWWRKRRAPGSRRRGARGGVSPPPLVRLTTSISKNSR